MICEVLATWETQKTSRGSADKELFRVGRPACPRPFVLLLVDPVRFPEILRRQRARVVRHLASCGRDARDLGSVPDGEGRQSVFSDLGRGESVDFAPARRLTLFDNLADKDFGETADDGQNRRRDGLLQDRVHELCGQCLSIRVHVSFVALKENDSPFVRCSW
jgi:hypothetical protein